MFVKWNLFIINIIVLLRPCMACIDRRRWQVFACEWFYCKMTAGRDLLNKSPFQKAECYAITYQYSMPGNLCELLLHLIWVYEWIWHSPYQAQLTTARQVYCTLSMSSTIIIWPFFIVNLFYLPLDLYGNIV